MKRLVLTTFFFEIGFLLIVIPWSAFWDRNYFAQALPAVHALITNNYVRGAVSGLGVINVIAGLVELGSMVLARSSDRTASLTPSQFGKE
jgi:hypothetical protein